MNSIRCNGCSLLNFADGKVCKRCGPPLESGDSAQFDSYPGEYNTMPASAAESDQFTNRWQYEASGYMTPHPPQKKSTARVFLALILLAALIGVPIYLTKGGKPNPANFAWRDFQSEDGAFSISMPGEVKHETASRTGPAGTLHIKVVGVDMGKDSAFMVMYADFPPQMANVPVDRLYDGVLKSMTTRGDMIVVGRRDITMYGRSGVEVSVEPPAGKGLVGKGICRVFWVPPRIYAIAAAGPDSADYGAATARFLESFKILKTN